MEIAVIGCGPGGYAAAIEAALRGAEVTVISNELGGECLNRGCIPTKLILKKKANRATLEKIIEQFNDITEQTKQGMYYNLKKHKVKLINGIASIDGTGTVFVDEQRIFYDYLIIATGSKANVVDLPPKYNVIDCFELLKTPDKLPPEVCILGAGAVGLEFAEILNNLGVKVTVSEQADEIIPSADVELARRLRITMQECGIGFSLHNTVPTCKNVICCCGRIPVLPFGAEFLYDNKKRLPLNENFKTIIPNIYAIGDCTGKSFEAAFAVNQAQRVVDDIFSIENNHSYEIAHCIYTSPNLAWVGTAGNSDLTVRYSLNEMLYNFDEAESAMMKITYDPASRRITSVHILSKQADTLISTAQMILRQNMTVDEMRTVCFPRPTVSEAFREIAMRAVK